MNLTFENTFPLILALLLIFIIPMLAARRGMGYGEFVKSLFVFGKKAGYSAAKEERRPKKEAILFNGRKNELTELLSELLRLSQQKKLGLVYPGTVTFQGETATLLCLVVTGHCVYGINCFGFSGTITDTGDRKPWLQHLNGQDISIVNPVSANQKQYTLVRSAMDNSGMSHVPLEIFGVFTNKNAILYSLHEASIFTRDNLLNKIQFEANSKCNILDINEISHQLKSLIRIIRK